MKYRIQRARKSLANPERPVSVDGAENVIGLANGTWDECESWLIDLAAREPEFYHFVGTDMLMRITPVSVTVYRIIPIDNQEES